MKSYPMLIFYRENFTEKGAVFGPPWFRLNYRKNEDPPAHSTSGGSGGSVPTSTGLHPGFILVTLTRALYGVLFGRGNPDPVEHFPSEVHAIDEGGYSLYGFITHLRILFNKTHVQFGYYGRSVPYYGSNNNSGSSYNISYCQFN